MRGGCPILKIVLFFLCKQCLAFIFVFCLRPFFSFLYSRNGLFYFILNILFILYSISYFFFYFLYSILIFILNALYLFSKSICGKQRTKKEKERDCQTHTYTSLSFTYIWSKWKNIYIFLPFFRKHFVYEVKGTKSVTFEVQKPFSNFGWNFHILLYYYIYAFPFLLWILTSLFFVNK